MDINDALTWLFGLCAAVCLILGFATMGWNKFTESEQGAGGTGIGRMTTFFIAAACFTVCTAAVATVSFTYGG